MKKKQIKQTEESRGQYKAEGIQLQNKNQKRERALRTSKLKT